MSSWDDKAKKLETTGAKIQGLGCLLTILITIPILLTVFLGPLGLGIGIVIAILGLVGHLKKKD